MIKMVDYHKHRVPYKKEETTVDKLIEMKDSHKYTRKELMAMVEYKGTEGSFQELIVKYKIPYLTYAQLTLPNQIRRLGDTSQLTIEEIKNLLGYKDDIRNLKAHCAMQKIPYKRLKWARL